ncbi:MAG: conjugal transfer protein TraB [Deltaproteobacteria bacterium]|nr:conjugal transfer protein TraB [Deltaproteobacteria bacterium]
MTANQNNNQQNHNKPITDDAILKVAKEVVVKFIESGRLSPDNFSKTFHDVFTAIKETAGKS